MKSWIGKVEKITTADVGGGGGGGTLPFSSITGSYSDNSSLNSVISDLQSEDASLGARLTSVENVLEGNLTDLAELELAEDNLIVMGPVGLDSLTVGSGLQVLGGVLSATGGGGGGATSLEDLSDTDIDIPLVGDFLRWDGDYWENFALTIGDIPGVNIAGITEGQFLVWDGSQFIPGDTVQAEETLKIIRGTVNASGTSTGSGWTTTKMGTGDYRINISPALSNAPSVVVTPSSSTDFRLTRVHSLTTTSFRVNIADLAGTAVDDGFCFEAAGGV